MKANDVLEGCGLFNLGKPMSIAKFKESLGVNALDVIKHENAQCLLVLDQETGDMVASVGKKYKSFKEVTDPVVREVIRVKVDKNSEFLAQDGSVWNRKVHTTDDLMTEGESFFSIGSKGDNGGTKDATI